MRNFLLKNKFKIILAAILATGVFLRVYHFSDWLHFELDQSRDAKVVELAVEHGIGNLPLLGPKAAGSFLRLGPAFYNFEYLSAVIFGETPSGIAVLNLIFGLMSLPLFYLFMRRYFDRRISLFLLALFSTSLFMVLYSRFAWNPNSLPFFILLCFYSLLRAADQNEKKKGAFLMLAAFSLAVLTQLHFVAFLGIPTVTFLFLLWKRPKIKWTFWTGAALIILTLYVPVVLNDVKTGGENIKEFTKIFAKKSSGGGNTLIEKGIKNYAENSLGYLLVTTSYEKAELPRVDQKGMSFDVICDKGCRNNLLPGSIALMIFSLEIIVLVWNSLRFFKKESDPRRDFVGLILLWFSVSFILFTPIAFDFAPRFFLIISALPFVLLGFMLEFLEKKIRHKKIFQAIFAISAILFLAANISAVKKRFSQLAFAKNQNFEINTDKILKEEYRVTLEQQEAVADYMESAYQENKFPVYVNSEPFYRRSFLYLLEKKNIASDDFRNSQLAKQVYRNGNYFLIYPQNVNLESRTKKYLENYDIVSKKEFGTLVVFQLKPKEAAINAEEQKFGPEKKARSASGVPVRCRWNEIFDECNPDEPEDAE